MEYLAFFIGFRYYLSLRKRIPDPISNSNRLSIILGAAIGALLGSRIIALLENPIFEFSPHDLPQLLSSKTIMGGLFGGLLGVEITKKIIGELHSSGDLFVFPIIIAIIIGRIGCFLSGVDEFTYGEKTSFFAGMDLGDGTLRHPLALYEIIFLIVLFFFLKHVQKQNQLQSGILFKYFMIIYFLFRFLMEFLKPNVFFVLGLSTIQWLCFVCMIYYNKTILKLIKHAR